VLRRAGRSSEASNLLCCNFFGETKQVFAYFHTSTSQYHSSNSSVGVNRVLSCVYSISAEIARFTNPALGLLNVTKSLSRRSLNSSRRRTLSALTASRSSVKIFSSLSPYSPLSSTASSSMLIFSRHVKIFIQPAIFQAFKLLCFAHLTLWCAALCCSTLPLIKKDCESVHTDSKWATGGLK